jgi:hypothetical protein
LDNAESTAMASTQRKRLYASFFRFADGRGAFLVCREVGRVMDQLRAMNADQDTVIFFLSASGADATGESLEGVGSRIPRARRAADTVSVPIGDGDAFGLHGLQG